MATLTKLALAATLTILPSCGLFDATDTKPALMVNEQRHTNFLEFYAPTKALIAGSQLPEAQKAAALAQIAVFEERENAFYRSTLGFLSEVGQFGADDWKTLYERSLQTIIDLRSKK